MALFHQIKRNAEVKAEAYAQKVKAIQSLAPAEGVHPKNRPGRKPDPNAKKLLTLRLDPDVIEHFKAAGEGWQTRMNEALRKAAGL